MLKPNDTQIRAIKNLETNVSWEEIVKWIEDSWIKQSVSINKLNGEATIKMQGRGLELEDLLTHIKKVDDYNQNAREAKRIGG